MKKLIQENLNFQNLKNEQSKDKNTNTNDDKGEKVSNNSSLIRNSSKGKNNITNKKRVVDISRQSDNDEKLNPHTSSFISKNFNNSEQKSNKTFRQIMDLSFVENQNNKQLLERYIKIKNNLYINSNERPKSLDPNKMTLVESVNYIYSILNKEKKGEYKEKCNEEMNLINSDKHIINVVNQHKFIEKKVLENEKNTSLEKEKQIEIIINMRKENKKLKDCANYYIKLCKDLAGEIIALRNEADKYKYMVTRKNE